MLTDSKGLPETVGHYQRLILESENQFGKPAELPEYGLRLVVEHAFRRELGGFSFTIFAPHLREFVRLKSWPYVRRCEREAMLDVDGTLYALIAFPEQEAWGRSAGFEKMLTRAVCVFPKSGVNNRLYFLPFGN
jgi:hypothetical protein